jgi:hypothetical protein
MTASPSGDSTDDALVAPRFVNLSYLLYLAAAALSIVSLIIALATAPILRQNVLSELAKQHRHVSESNLNATFTAVTAINVLFAIVWVVLFVLFARKMRKGASWARNVLVIVTLLSFINYGSGYGAGVAQVLAAIVASVLLFFPKSSAYFAAVKQAKLAGA